ncbi:MAG: hypothetical protein HFJ28_05185 [Clostridia bacterium]|nr:hypothetical protein [Clostridia bacterium]
MFESGHEVLGNNLYIYCNNDPINNIDPNGEGVVTLATILAAVGIFAVKAVGVIKVAAVVVAAVVTVVATVNVVTNVVNSTNNKKNATTSINRNTTNKSTRNATTTIQSATKSAIVQANRYVKPPSKLKEGDKVKTPDSHPHEFIKNKNGPGYTHNKTGWQAKPDPSNHGGPHWDMNPPRGSGHINVGPNGNIFGGSK